MTEKQKIFADEYLIDLNATRAYRVAYPSVKKDETAAAAAARMLRNVKYFLFFLTCRNPWHAWVFGISMKMQQQIIAIVCP